MGSAEPSRSGVDKHNGTAAGGRPGLAPSRGGGVRASEGTNPSLRAHLDQVLHTVVLPGLTRLNSEGARLNR